MTNMYKYTYYLSSDSTERNTAWGTGEEEGRGKESCLFFVSLVFLMKEQGYLIDLHSFISYLK